MQKAKERVFDIDFLVGIQKCEVCSKDISRTAVVLCCTCGIVLCLPCLYKGTEVSDHRRSDNYTILDSLDKTIYSPDWTAREELMLMKGRVGNETVGVEKFGVDNWSEIAEHIVSKSAEECEDHYYSFYYRSSKPPAQKQSKNGKLKGSGDKARRARKASSKKQRAAKGEKENGIQEIAGYMPLREEFAVEHDNDAELLLADMEFFEDDPDAELKFKILEMYNNVLDERSTRKKFVLENKLLDVRTRETEGKRPREEREVRLQMRPFQRYLDTAQFNELVQGLVEERRLQRELAKAQGFPQSKAAAHEKSRQRARSKDVELTEREKEFCIILKLEEQVFGEVKAKLMGKVGKMGKEAAKKLANSEVSKEQVMAIYEYLSYYNELPSKSK